MPGEVSPFHKSVPIQSKIQNTSGITKFAVRLLPCQLRIMRKVSGV